MYLFNKCTVNTLYQEFTNTLYIATLDNLVSIENIGEEKATKTGEAVRNYEH